MKEFIKHNRHTLNSLLKEIEMESSQVQQTFKSSGVHRTLEDFSRAIDNFEKLDDPLKSNVDVRF